LESQPGKAERVTTGRRRQDLPENWCYTLIAFFPEEIMMRLSSKLRMAVASVSVLAVVIGTANNAVAADDAIAFGKEMFKLSLGYYRPNFSSRVAVGLPGSVVPPGTIDGEQDLGLDNNLGGARFDGYWRFADRHRLMFGYYKLDRSASRVLDKDIGPINIPGLPSNEYILSGSSINTEAKWEIFILGYGYSFYKTDTVEIAGQIGLNVAQLSTQIGGTLYTTTNNVTPLTGTTVGSTVTAPLPAIGFSGDWALDDRWRIRGHAGGFKITIQDVDANVVDAALAGEYRVYGNIWGGLGYTILNASAKKNDGSSNASLDWRTGGWQLYGSMLF
jgi:hypothetical protein